MGVELWAMHFDLLPWCLFEICSGVSNGDKWTANRPQTVNIMVKQRGVARAWQRLALRCICIV